MDSAKGHYNNIGFIIKLTIAASSFVYIYLKLTDSSQFNEVKTILTFNKYELGILIITLLLMPANWSLESLKWKILVKPHEPLSFFQCLKSVLAGVTTSVFTPNRIGEFAGKIFSLKKTNRITAIIASIIGSCGQLCITLLFGSISMCFYFFFFADSSNNTFMQIVSILFLFIVVFFFVLYLSPQVLIKIISKTKKWNNYTDVLLVYSSKTLLTVLQLSLLRYLVFSVQFYLLLSLFSVEINAFTAFTMIALTFLGITAIPTITITELGIRGSAALLFLGQYSSNHAGIIAASFTLWLVNIAVPALLGLPFIFSLTFFRERK